MKYLLLILALALGYEGYTNWPDIQARYDQAYAQVMAARGAAKAGDSLSIPGEPAPGVTRAAPAVSAAPAAGAPTVAESQRKAIAKYPALSVANSEMNSRFVFRYKRMLKEKSARLQDPTWPMQLADECADAIAASAPKGKTPGSDKSRPTGALASAGQTTAH